MSTYHQTPYMHRVCSNCQRSRDAHYFYDGSLHCPGNDADKAKAGHIADLIEQGAELAHIRAKLRASYTRQPDLCLARALRVVGALADRNAANPAALQLALDRVAALADYMAKE